MYGIIGDKVQCGSLSPGRVIQLGDRPCGIYCENLQPHNEVSAQ